MTTRSILPLLAALSTGCTTGGLGTEATLAREPAGIRVLLEFEPGRIVGELLQVRSEGLLLHVDGDVSTIPVEGPVILLPGSMIPDRFRAGTDFPIGEERGRRVRWASEGHREWLRGLSRFPWGMTPEVEARLLEAYGQTRVGRVTPGGEAGGAVDPAAFLEDVARATALFDDRDVAIRHGYRRVGPDFPGMGEHWVNPGRVLSGGIEPARPQILTYVDVAGTPRLTGVAFAVPLSAGESVPEGPLPPEAWHDHGGSLDEEALILESPHSARHAGEGPRLAMVHAWLWPENPDGHFAQNNWALAWVRVGLDPPDRPDPLVARALSLAGDGADYYRRLLRRSAGVEAAAPDGAATVIDHAVGRAALRTAAVMGAREGGPLAPHETQALVRAWRGLWDDLRRNLDEATWSRLEPAFREWSGPSTGHGSH